MNPEYLQHILNIFGVGLILFSLVTLLSLYFSSYYLSRGMQGVFSNLLTKSLKNAESFSWSQWISGGVISSLSQSRMGSSYAAISFARAGLFSPKQLYMFLSSAGLGTVFLPWIVAVNWSFTVSSLLLFLGLLIAFTRGFQQKSWGYVFSSLGALLYLFYLFNHFEQFFPDAALMLIYLESTLRGSLLAFGLAFVMGFFISLWIRSGLILVMISMLFFSMDVLPLKVALLILCGAFLSGEFYLYKNYSELNTKISQILKWQMMLKGTLVVGCIVFLYHFELQSLLAAWISKSPVSFSASSPFIIPAFYTFIQLTYMLLALAIWRLVEVFIKRQTVKEPQKLEFIGSKSQ